MHMLRSSNTVVCSSIYIASNDYSGISDKGHSSSEHTNFGVPGVDTCIVLVLVQGISRFAPTIIPAILVCHNNIGRISQFASVADCFPTLLVTYCIPSPRCSIYLST